jgi:hypothetical protein
MRLFVPIAVVCLLALAPAAYAATPFTAGTGGGHDLAVGSDGRGHVVWIEDGTDDRIRYCRVPAGGSACDSESTILNFPGTQSSSPSPHTQVFTPAANKVVILASCHQCSDTATRTFRFISTDNGANFSAATQVGNVALNGQSGFVNSINTALSVAAATFQAQDDPPTNTANVTLGQSPTYVYDATVAMAPGEVKAVYAVHNLNAVRYRVFTDPTGPLTAVDLNTAANWSGNLTLAGAESDNEETHLSTGLNGIYLSYRYGQPTENKIGVRKFNSGTNAFSGPTYVEGSHRVDDSGIALSNHSQDASGRLHVIWRSLYDGNRLRYTRSDTGGGNFSAPANLATRESFFDPVVEAGPTGTGFAAWRASGSAIRVVRIDPQPEPAAPGGGGPGPGPGGGGDTTPPTAGGFAMGDPTLFPGQGTSFTFNSSEAGLATLTVQKRVKGLKVRIRGRRRCVPQTRRRLRALRRRAGSAAEYRRLLRRRRCRAYKRIGRIQQAVTPGRNTIVFNGRIAGRRLRPGRYRALLVIRDNAGNVSRTEQVRFRVFRRRG